MDFKSSAAVLFRLAKAYRKKPIIDLSSRDTRPESALTRYLLYCVLPLWASAGLLDWHWHRKTDIEHTAGITESLIHVCMFAEAGIPLMMGLVLEVNAGLLSAMVAALVLHQATAVWDVSFAEQRREVRPNEQHIHSLLEVLPFMALSMAATLHWDQAQSIFDVGNRKPVWKLQLKKKRLPGRYLAGIAGLIAFAGVVPYANEIYRCWKARSEPRSGRMRSR